MTAATLGSIMDNLGTALATVPGLNVYDYPPESAVPPFAFLDMPEAIDYDLTYSRAYNRYTIPVYVAVGSQVDREARDAIVAYTNTTVGQVKDVIEALSGSGVSYRVTRATFSNIGLTGGSYPGVVFSVDVAG